MKAFITTKLIILSMLLGISCSKTDVVTPTTTAKVIKAGKYLGPVPAGDVIKSQSFVNFSADNVPSSIGLILPKAIIDNIINNLGDVGGGGSYRLPEEAYILNSFTGIVYQKGNYYNVLQDYKSFLIEFGVGSGAYTIGTPDPDKGIIPDGFKKNIGYYGESYFINDDKTLMLRPANNSIRSYTVIVDKDKMRNNPNISFTIPLPTQKGFFPTKASVIQTGTDIEVVLDGLTEVK